jgi:hypothetical protein
MTQANHRRLELPGWVKVSLFAATLLTATWLMLWLDAAQRR